MGSSAWSLLHPRKKKKKEKDQQKEQKTILCISANRNKKPTSPHEAQTTNQRPTQISNTVSPHFLLPFLSSTRNTPVVVVVSLLVKKRKTKREKDDGHEEFDDKEWKKSRCVFHKDSISLFLKPFGFFFFFFDDAPCFLCLPNNKRKQVDTHQTQTQMAPPRSSSAPLLFNDLYHHVLFFLVVFCLHRALLA